MSKPSVFQLFAEFDAAAQDWGYQADQGTGDRLQEARLDYERTKSALLQRLMDIRDRDPEAML